MSDRSPNTQQRPQGDTDSDRRRTGSGSDSLRPFDGEEGRAFRERAPQGQDPREAASQTGRTVPLDADPGEESRASRESSAPATPRMHRISGSRSSRRSQPSHTTTFSQTETLRGAGGGPDRVSVPRWFVLALIGLVVALLVVVVVLWVRACSVERPQQEETPQEWVNPYNWDNLATLSNGLLAYYENGELASEAGVDVSEHDGAIDWQTVAASGVDFAMIRLGYRGYGPDGNIVLDSYFVDNITGAKAAGIKVGVYFFSQAVTEDEAREEARFVLDQLKQVGVELDYPIAFDEEPITNGDVARTDGISNSQLTANALAFCQVIENAGYTPMIYGNQHDLAKLDLTGELAAYDVWLAEYEVSAPTARTDFVMWQYTENGTVSGIPTTEGWVDLNIRFLVE